MNNKSLSSVFLIAILTGGLILAMCFGTVHASILKPSVPEFTLKYADYSYDVPPKTSSTIDPYTNKTITTTIPGYHVENKTIEATIKNNIGASYYNFRYKGHYTDEWSYHPFRPSSSRGYMLPDAYSVPYEASTLDFTVAALPSYLFEDVPGGGKVDVQVQALFGDFRAVPYGHIIDVRPTYDFYFEGTTSDWSNTQTLTIGEGQTPAPSPIATPTPTPTSEPTPIPVPGQSYFFVESTSTVSELFFNSTSSELSFTVSGESETAGYVKVTIAKSLVSSVQNVKVYLDGSQLDVAITEDEDSWLLNFNYVHSTHHVRISLAANAATTTFLGIENWIWAGIAIAIVVIGAGLLVYFKKRNN